MMRTEVTRTLCLITSPLDARRDPGLHDPDLTGHPSFQTPWPGEPTNRLELGRVRELTGEPVSDATSREVDVWRLRGLFRAEVSTGGKRGGCRCRTGRAEGGGGWRTGPLAGDGAGGEAGPGAGDGAGDGEGGADEGTHGGVVEGAELHGDHQCPHVVPVPLNKTRHSLDSRMGTPESLCEESHTLWSQILCPNNVGVWMKPERLGGRRLSGSSERPGRPHMGPDPGKEEGVGDEDDAQREEEELSRGWEFRVMVGGEAWEGGDGERVQEGVERLEWERLLTACQAHPGHLFRLKSHLRVQPINPGKRWGSDAAIEKA